jgi:hypothetical protein
MMRIVSKSLVAVATVGAVVVAPITASAVGGLDGPLFGLDAAPNGDVLVADASSGITVIRNDRVRSSIALPGASAVSAIGTKSMWVTTSGEDPESDSGQALWRVSNGSARMVANLFELEETDPDGAGVDSNPYDVASLGGGAALVVDAGGNSLWRVSNQGRATLVATFPEDLLSTANFNDICTDLGPFGPPCPIPAPAIPGQAVPTSVAVGPDGAYYVGELKGFPAPTDQSNIWRIEPGATGLECGVDPQCTKVFDGGFTSIVDLDFGPDGTLYVSELDEASWAAVEIFNNPVGGTANACDLATLNCQEIATDVPQHTALTVDKKGTVYATVNGLTPGAGQVITIP